jgi:hypothetical protein
LSKNAGFGSVLSESGSTTLHKTPQRSLFSPENLSTLTAGSFVRPMRDRQHAVLLHLQNRNFIHGLLSVLPGPQGTSPLVESKFAAI